MSRLTYTDSMADDRTDTHPHAPEEHWCEHEGCNEWGGFGFYTSKSAPTRWWCARHYPYWPDDIRAKYEALPED